MRRAAPRVVRRTRGREGWRLVAASTAGLAGLARGGIKIQGTGMMGRFVPSLDLVMMAVGRMNPETRHRCLIS